MVLKYFSKDLQLFFYENDHIKSEGLTSAFSVRRRSSRARLSLYDIHTRQDQIPTPDAHIGKSF